MLDKYVYERVGGYVSDEKSLMKFDVVVGNPPYQIGKNGKNVDVWPMFVDLANAMGDIVTMIHPGRWIVPKKKMYAVRDMLLSHALFYFIYFEDSSDVFYGTSIDGGVTCTFFNHNSNNTSVIYDIGINSNDRLEYKTDEIFLGNYYERLIYENIVDKFDIDYNSIMPRVKGSIGSLGSSDFGYKKNTMVHMLQDNQDGLVEPIRLWANNSFGKGSRFDWHYIEKNILDQEKYVGISHGRKVMLDKKGNGITANGKGNGINNQPVIMESNETSVDVLFVFPENDTDYELNLIVSMFRTKTIRFLMSLIQKGLYVTGFDVVPDYTLFMDDLNGQLFTDEWLYNYFDFSDELISYIEAHVSPK